MAVYLVWPILNDLCVFFINTLHASKIRVEASVTGHCKYYAMLYNGIMN